MKINADANRALKTDDVRKRFDAVGSDVIGSTPEELAKRMAEESDRYGALIRELKISRD